jgi:uncharacterized protein
MKKFIFIINLFLIYILLFSFTFTSVEALNSKSLSMKLLSVAEINGTREGNIATLNIEARQGRGRVFIDTFPLTKLDTQISTRFAKETACKFLNRNCDYVDFFYTLRSDAPLLGGPSAGASVAVITVALIEGLTLDDKTAMTGTINSGNIIGQVSGIKYKIDAAHLAGLNKVIIPYGETSYTNNNITYDFVEYGKQLGIEVVYVQNLNQAVYEFTKKTFQNEDLEIDVPYFYTKTMMEITKNICTDSFAFETKYHYYDEHKLINLIKLKELDVFYNKSKEELFEQLNIQLNSARRLVNDSLNAYSTNSFYSAASFCFGANIRFKHFNNLLNYEGNGSDLIEELNLLEKEVNIMLYRLDNRELITITDLQALMVVRERLLETDEQIKLAKEAFDSNNLDALIYRFVYANERFNTANLWSKFFDQPGKNLKLNQDRLRNSCIRKISETQERIEYVRLLFPSLDFNSYTEGLSQSSRYLLSDEYALCLFKASKTKAEVDLFISAVGSSDLEKYVPNKLDMVKNVISNQQRSDLFPILGYSYYEYGKLLLNDDLSSSLLYSEYALELSDLDIYFGVRRKPYLIIDWFMLIYFALGLFSGFVVFIMIYKYKNKYKKTKKIKLKKTV